MQQLKLFPFGLYMDCGPIRLHWRHTHTPTPAYKQRSEREKEMVQWGQNKDKRWSGGRESEMPFAGYDWHWLACPNVFGKFAFPCPNFGFQSAPLRPQIHIEKLINLVLVVTWNTNTPDPPLPPSQLLSAFCACVCVFFFFVLGPTRGIVYLWSPIRETEGEASALPVSNLSSIYIYC